MDWIPARIKRFIDNVGLRKSHELYEERVFSSSELIGMNPLRHFQVNRRKILLVDTRDKRLEPYRLVLQSSGTFEVTATVSWTGIQKLRPPAADIVLLYVCDGSDAARMIRLLKDTLPSAELVVVAGSLDASRVTEILKAGANGLVSVESSLLEFMQAMMNMVNRGAAITADVARIVVRSFHAFQGSDMLGRREKEVLEHLSEGLTSSEMAQVLGISAQTVKSHVKNIYKKLGAKKRSEAIARAKTAGILPQRGK